MGLLNFCEKFGNIAKMLNWDTSKDFQLPGAPITEICTKDLNVRTCSTNNDIVLKNYDPS